MYAIYTRQSVDKKESISIEAQIEYCKKEILDKNHYKIYTDKGYSGKNTKRPDFEKMIGDIQNNIISKVIVYRLDRISRSIIDFANIIKMFQDYNVEFISSTEKFDTSTPIGRAMLYIVLVFAQLERETIQERIVENYYLRGSKGYFLGGRIPYGFNKKETTINNKKTNMLVENPTQLNIVKEMYNLYATTNMSLGQICNYFNEKRILSADNKNWDSSKISRMLKSPLYVKADADIYMYYKDKGCIITNELSDFKGINGCFMFGKRPMNERKYTNVKDHILVIAPHEGAIDSIIWLKCQYKLDNNRQIKNSGKGKYSWLSGIIKCGYCNYATTVNTFKNYKYFKCRGKYNYKICNGHSRVIRVENIEDIVEKFLLNHIEKHEKISGNQIVETGNENTKVNEAKLRLIEIENQIENLINQIAEGNEITIKYINQKISNLDNKKSILQEEIKQYTANKSIIDNEKIFKKAKMWDKLFLEEKKQICMEYINKVFIMDDKIEIEWRILL